MKKYVFIILTSIFAFCTASVSAQENLELKLDTKPALRMSDYASKLREALDYGFRGNYQIASFINSTYYKNKVSGDIGNKAGYDVAFTAKLWLFLLDISYFKSSFEVNSSSYYPTHQDALTSLSGVDFYMSYILLPDWGKISKILVPHIGIGYQTASLSAKIKNGEKKEIVGSLDMSAPMWKGGLNINIGKLIFLNVEYKQSIFISERESINIISFGGGIRISYK
jgi:hypothetical protein